MKILEINYVNFRDLIDRKLKKEYSFNRKKIPYDEFYGKVNVISFIPEDIELIVGSPSVRRKFFDGEISQGNEEYFKNLKEYTKLLKIRNKYLKDGNYRDEMFQIYQDEFIKYGAKLIKKRIEYVKNISIILNLNYRKLFDNKKELSLKYNIYQDEFIKYGAKLIKKRIEYVKNISIILNLNYRKLFDNKKELSLKYNSFLGDIKNIDINHLEELFRQKIKDEFFREIRYGYSNVGPQKDDFLFLLDEKEAKSFSSQGEKKSIIFSLKLSEIDMILKEKRENPVFLIDDVSSYFDSIRKENILDYLEKRDIQVIITSTEKMEIGAKIFFVKSGEIYEDC